MILKMKLMLKVTYLPLKTLNLDAFFPDSCSFLTRTDINIGIHFKISFQLADLMLQTLIFMGQVVNLLLQMIILRGIGMIIWMTMLLFNRLMLIGFLMITDITVLTKNLAL